MSDLPTTNSTEVTAAPNQTSRQRIATSGINLNMDANRQVMMPNETTKLRTSAATWAWGNQPSLTPPTADDPAETTRETRSRNPTPNTIENDRKRERTNPQ